MLLRYIDKEGRRFFFYSVLAAVLTILSGAMLFGLSAFLIAFCGFHPFISEIMVAVVGVRFFGLLRGILRYLERLITHDTTFRLIGRIRGDLLLGLENCSYEELNNLETNDTLIRLVDDTERLQDFYLRTFLPLLSGSVCGILGLLWFQFLMGPESTILFGICYFGSMVLWPIISLLSTKKAVEETVVLQSTSKKKMLEYFGNYMDIAGNNAEDRWEEDLEKCWTITEKAEKRISDISCFTNGLHLVFVNTAVCGILYLGWKLAEQNLLDRLYIPVLALIMSAIFEGAGALQNFYEKYVKSHQSAKRVFELFHLPQKHGNKVQNGIKRNETSRRESLKKSMVEARISERMNHDIVMENVGYHVNAQEILRNISIDLVPGKKIAILGESGSGKTTLGKILAGIVTETSGKVCCEGERATLFAVVPQHVFLFNTSIRNNLRIGSPDATDHELEEVLRMVCLWDLVSDLPGKLQEEIGENGMRLSGGERQRLAIARALLQKRPYLILDESTCSLDIRTEKKVLQNIFRERSDMGVILITHRLTMTEECDAVYVLKNGCMLEYGTPHELLEMNGWYERMKKKRNPGDGGFSKEKESCIMDVLV